MIPNLSLAQQGLMADHLDRSAQRNAEALQRTLERFRPIGRRR
jgi:hypothetical protein